MNEQRCAFLSFVASLRLYRLCLSRAGRQFSLHLCPLTWADAWIVFIPSYLDEESLITRCHRGLYNSLIILRSSDLRREMAHETDEIASHCQMNVLLLLAGRLITCG